MLGHYVSGSNMVKMLLCSWQIYVKNYLLPKWWSWRIRMTQATITVYCFMFQTIFRWPLWSKSAIRLVCVFSGRHACCLEGRLISMATGRQQSLLTAVHELIMTERGMEKLKRAPNRVFINNIDSYASKCIAKVNVECQN